MSPTSTDQTLHTATRLRSSGATRDQTIDALMGGGLRLAEANEQIDAIDKKLGWDGRTLPEDTSAPIRQQVREHREALKAAEPTPTAAPAPVASSAPGPRFESAVRPGESETTPSRNVVPSVAELAAGSAPATRPTFVTPSSATADQVAEPVKAELTTADKARLRDSATRRARTSTSPERVAEWLVREGMSEQEATSVARTAWQRAVNQRQQAQSAHRGDQTMAWLEIVAGVALLIGGLAAGWFVGLFVFIIIDGFRRLGSS